MPSSICTICFQHAKTIVLFVMKQSFQMKVCFYQEGLLCTLIMFIKHVLINGTPINTLAQFVPAKMNKLKKKSKLSIYLCFNLKGLFSFLRLIKISSNSCDTKNCNQYPNDPKWKFTFFLIGFCLIHNFF